MKLTLPLSVTLPRKTKAAKVFILNLNVYRNTHHMTLNQAKVAYKEMVTAEVAGQRLEFPPPYLFTYTVFPGSNRAFDLGNVLPIVQKFTDDSLIDLGVIPDDNHKVVSCVIYRKGDLDKDNPRAELEITKLYL